MHVIPLSARRDTSRESWNHIFSYDGHLKNGNVEAYYADDKYSVNLTADKHMNKSLSVIVRFAATKSVVGFSSLARC